MPSKTYFILCSTNVNGDTLYWNKSNGWFFSIEKATKYNKSILTDNTFIPPSVGGIIEVNEAWEHIRYYTPLLPTPGIPIAFEMIEFPVNIKSDS